MGNLWKDDENQGTIMIAAGYGHTLALTKKGDLYTFGFNIKGQLGVGDRFTRFKPEKLNQLYFIFQRYFGLEITEIQIYRLWLLQ